MSLNAVLTLPMYLQKQSINPIILHVGLRFISPYFDIYNAFTTYKMEKRK